MAFKLAIEDKVYVPIKGTLAGSARGNGKKINFGLVMERMDQGQIDEAMKSGETIPDFVTRLTSAWQDQRLVLNEDDTPAEFGEAAMRELMKVPAMAVWCFQAYLREVGVQEKN